MNRTNIKSPHITETSEFLIERIKSNLEDAMDVLPEWFWHWQIFNERPCICKINTNEGGNTACPFCYGTGCLPGYSKIGFKTEIFNFISPWQTINIESNLITNQIYPSFFLNDTSVKGKLETAWVSIGKNYGLDNLEPLCEGNVVVKAWDGKDLYDTTNDYETFEKAFTEFTKLKFIIEMNKKELSDESPMFSGLKLRYKTSTHAEIRGDIPQFNFEMERNDVGDLLTILDSMTMFLVADEAGNVKIGDFFEHVRPVTYKDNNNRKNLPVKFRGTGNRFKLQRTETLAPKGNLICTTATIRLLQPNEPLMLIN